MKPKRQQEALKQFDDSFDALVRRLIEPQFPEPCWVCHACKGILQASVDTGKQMHCPQCQEPMHWYGPPRRFTAPDDAIDVQAEDVTHLRIEEK